MEENLLKIPTLCVSLSSLRATIDTEAKELLASSTSKTDSLSMARLHLKHKLSLSRRCIDASGPGLEDVIPTTTVSGVAPVMRSSKRISLVLTPGSNVAAAVASNRDGVLVSDGTDTDVGIGPEGQAIIADGRVPLLELLKGDAIVGGDLGAAFILLNKVELVTVVHHAGLDGKGSHDAVVALG
jgi:hypothetical protein